MYDRILVPTDGCESTERAIDEAIGLAREHDSTLHTLYVVNSAAIAPGIDFDDLEFTYARRYDEGQFIGNGDESDLEIVRVPPGGWPLTARFAR